MKNLCKNLIKFWKLKNLEIFYLKEKKRKGLFINSEDILLQDIIAKLSLINNPEWLKDEKTLIYFKKIYKNKSRGKVLAYFIINDKKYPAIVHSKNKIIFNFDPEETIENLLADEYVKQRRPIHTYFPFHYHMIPFRLLISKILAKLFNKKTDFPSWPIEISVELIRWIFLKSYEKVYKKKIGMKFWPKKYVVILSHDIDTSGGFKNIPKFSKLEEERKIVSTWNIVAKHYKLDYEVLDKLYKRGHEIVLHGFNHDGKIAFLNKGKIKSRIRKCLKLIKKYKIKGFRSPALLVSKNLFEILSKSFNYDSSVADTEIFIPGSENRGCCSIFPFMKNSLLELPLTIPMDSTLLIWGYKPEEIYNLWVKKIKFIKKLGGLAVLTTHTDSHFSGNQKMLKIYSKILDFIINDKDALILTANRVAEFWKNVHIKIT